MCCQFDDEIEVFTLKNKYFGVFVLNGLNELETDTPVYKQTCLCCQMLCCWRVKDRRRTHQCRRCDRLLSAMNAALCCLTMRRVHHPASWEHLRLSSDQAPHSCQAGEGEDRTWNEITLVINRSQYRLQLIIPKGRYSEGLNTPKSSDSIG